MIYNKPVVTSTTSTVRFQIDISAAGTKRWHVNGVWHRLNGPAVEYANGDVEWYWNGALHCKSGPAISYNDGTKRWFLYGEEYNCMEWILKLYEMENEKNS